MIDVHAHFLTGEYVRQATTAGHQHPDGMPAWPQWDADRHLDLMDQCGITKALLSISSPGVHFGDDHAAAALATHVNDAAAEIVGQHPDRFGFFASLPLPDVGAALHELHRTLDLGASGAILESNIDGRYLGDPAFEPVYAELERRNAVLFLHPTSPRNWQQVSAGRPRPMLEFPFETTRTITDMALNGVLDRYPRLRIVVPHAGAALPLLADRVDLFGQAFFGSGVTPLAEHLRRLWFDLAGTPFPHQVPALVAVAGKEHLLYGSDYCWTPAPAVAAQVATIGTEWRELTTANALELLGPGAAAE